MSGLRSWMYPHKDGRGLLRPEFSSGVEMFVKFALSSRGKSNKGTLLCPCQRCGNKAYLDCNTVKMHLIRCGFMPNYFIWSSHGESHTSRGSENEIGETSGAQRSTNVEGEISNSQMDMVLDELPRFNSNGASYSPEEPNIEANAFYELLRALQEPMHPGSNVSLLESASRFMLDKVTGRSSHATMEGFFNLYRRCMLNVHQDFYPDSFRKVRKIFTKLGMTVIKYDVCPKNCFLYYKEGESLDCCPVCNEPRYKPTTYERRKNIAKKTLWYFPISERLQRLYMSGKTAELMTWHTNCKSRSEKVIHPAGSQAWEEFDRLYPEFAADPRNVRLGLSCDESKLNKGIACSIWPIMVTPYNLPPEFAMRQEFIFLTLIISGPNSPGKSMDVMLRPVIDELKSLWSDGALTYDSFKKQNFRMKAAVMCTISDFSTYEMLSGWRTRGKLACPCCMEDTDSFTLLHEQKPSWFDCHRKFLPGLHRERLNKNDYRKDREVRGVQCPERKSGEEIKKRVDALPPVKFGTKYKKIPGFGKEHNWIKRSIFWELPYWPSLLVRHILDVMDIEKKVFKNVTSTIFDDPNTSNDNLNSRKDLEEHTTRHELFLSKDSNRKPKASYTLTAEEREAVRDWFKSLRFPDGHVSNVASNVKLDSTSINGLNGHDCHVFMQRLLPTAFREFLPVPIWDALTELSIFFRAICASEISQLHMFVLSSKVVETICKLEKIFPPSFFNFTEHIIIHLPFEAMVAGPMYYRCLYPFKRKMWVLKKNYMNKKRYEDSICEAYLMTEITNFCSFYFGSEADAPATRLTRNEKLQMGPAFENPLSIFIPKGQPKGKAIVKKMSAIDMNEAIFCIIRNCPEAAPYIRMFVDQLGRRRGARDDLIPWMRKLAQTEQARMDPRIRVLLLGAYQFVEMYEGYVSHGGLEFHTEHHGKKREIMCSGVSFSSGDITYYGMLQEVIEIAFHELGILPQKICLFNCRWYAHKEATRVHPKYGLVDIDSNKFFHTTKGFVFAERARQVCYLEYPSTRLPRPPLKGFLAVCPVGARHAVSISSTLTDDDTEKEYYQDPVAPPFSPMIDELSGFVLHNKLAERNGCLIEISVDDNDQINKRGKNGYSSGSNYSDTDSDG